MSSGSVTIIVLAILAQLEEDLRPPGVLAQLPLRACAASTPSWPRGAGYSLHPSCEVTL